MFTEKSKVLADAPSALNKPEQVWEVTVEGDSIIARCKGEAETSGIDTKTALFTFIATLKDNGKWKELDKLEKTSTHATGASKSVSVGKTYQKSMEFSIGRNKDTGKLGINEISSFDTAAVKRAIRDYLTACGWKKAGLLG